MKASALKRGVTLLAALLIVLVSVVPVLSAGTVRVFIEFKPGSQAAVRAELQRAGAEIHYQFDRLQSFVVSVPERALAGLSRNPNVVAIEVDPVRELVRNMPAPVTELILPEQVVPYGIDMVQARDVWGCQPRRQGG